MVSVSGEHLGSTISLQMGVHFKAPAPLVTLHVQFSLQFDVIINSLIPKV